MSAYLNQAKADTMTLKERIRQGLCFSGTTLVEIGALCRPFLLKSEGDVRYVDYADTPTLRAKYHGHPDVDADAIVEVDAVWGEHTLQGCLGEATKADYVLASHVIEHVPDLLTWLQELRSVLKPDGEIRLAIPDRRFTFDYIRRETTLQDVIDAYLRRARCPLPANIYDHLAHARTVDVRAAWAGTLDAATLQAHHTFDAAMVFARDALQSGTYHDVHCWVFTPQSFALLMKEAAQHGLMDLMCHDFADTPPNTLEFTVFLRAGTDRQAICDSWARMAQALTPQVPDPRELQLQAMVGELAEERERQQMMRLELAALQVRLASAQARAAAYEASTSWRLTSPLRKIVSVLRSARH